MENAISTNEIEFASISIKCKIEENKTVKLVNCDVGHNFCNFTPNLVRICAYPCLATANRVVE